MSGQRNGWRERANAYANPSRIEQELAIKLQESKALICRVYVLIPELATILRKQDVELLVHTRELLDEILETLEVSSDPRTSKALKEGLKDMKNGKVRPYRDFVRELRSSHEL